MNRAERSPGSLVGLVMRDVVTLTGIGIGFGLLLSIAGARFVSEMLYQVRPTDAATIALAVGTLAFAAILAGYLPARRAARIDPG